MKITYGQLKEMISESVKRTLNEIGDTTRGQYMLGRLDARNRMERENSPDGRHGAYKGAAEDTAIKNWKDDPTLEPSFDKGWGDEHAERDSHFKKSQYNMHSMNDRDALGTKFINFLQRDDNMLQIVQEYESEGKDAFNEVMDAFEEKLGYTLTDKSRKACKKAYNMWWYYNGQYVLSGMEESKVRQIAIGKMLHMVTESVKRQLTERYYNPYVTGYESGSADITNKVMNAFFEKYGPQNDEMDPYVEKICDIPMVVYANFEMQDEPEVGYHGYEITNVEGVDDIKRAIMAKGLPENIAKEFCDVIDGVVEGLEYDDFATSEIEPDPDEYRDERF